jgi:hypothetical protein
MKPEEDYKLYVSHNDQTFRVIYQEMPIMADTTDRAKALAVARQTADRTNEPVREWRTDRLQFTAETLYTPERINQ